MAKKRLTKTALAVAPVPAPVVQAAQDDDDDIDPRPDAADTAHDEPQLGGQCGCGIHTAETCAESCDHPDQKRTAAAPDAEPVSSKATPAAAPDAEPVSSKATPAAAAKPAAPKHPQANHPALEGHDPNVIARALAIYDQNATCVEVEQCVHQAVREFTGAGR